MQKHTETAVVFIYPVSKITQAEKMNTLRVLFFVSILFFSCSGDDKSCLSLYLLHNQISAQNSEFVPFDQFNSIEDIYNFNESRNFTKNYTYLEVSGVKIPVRSEQLRRNPYNSRYNSGFSIYIDQNIITNVDSLANEMLFGLELFESKAIFGKRRIEISIDEQIIHAELKRRVEEITQAYCKVLRNDEYHDQLKLWPIVIVDGTLPPPPPKTPSYLKLEQEADSLLRNREKKVIELSNMIAKSCGIIRDDRIALSIVILNSGETESIDVIDDLKNNSEKVRCAKRFIETNDINLGRMIFIRSTNRRMTSVKYTMPIMK